MSKSLKISDETHRELELIQALRIAKGERKETFNKILSRLIHAELLAVKGKNKE